MRLDSFRFLVGPLVLALAVAGSAAAQETTVVGTWALDLKASQNVPEAQKGVDLKISVDGKLLTTARFAGETAVGEPAVIILDGVSRPQTVGGQKATVVAKWLKPGVAYEHVISMMQTGSVFPTTQKIVTEASSTGTTLTRRYEVRRAQDVQDRLLVYRRK
jgi:hypothetical protein